MKKRIAGLLLCLVMVLGLLPTTAWAEDGVAKVEVTDSSGQTTTNNYTSFSAALIAANAVEAGTVKLTLLNNCEESDVEDITRDMTLDLNGKTLKIGSSGTASFSVAGVTVTVQDSTGNGKLDAILIASKAGSSVTVESGNFTEARAFWDGKITINGGTFGKVWINLSGKVTINGGTIETLDAATTGITLYGGTFTTITNTRNNIAYEYNKVLSLLASGCAYRYYDASGNPTNSWFTDANAYVATASNGQTLRVEKAPLKSLKIGFGGNGTNDETLTVGYGDGELSFLPGIDKPDSTLRGDISYTYYLGTDQNTLFSDGNRVDNPNSNTNFRFPTGKGVGTYYVGGIATVYGYSIKSGIVKVTVQKAGQTVTASNVTATYGDTGSSVSASGYGNVTYAVTSGNDVVDVNRNTGALTIKKAGTATITATAAGDDSHNSGSTTINVTVNPKTIRILSTTINDRAYDGTTVASATITFTDAAGGVVVELGKNTDYTVKADFADKNVGPHTVNGTVTLLNENYCFENNSRTATFESGAWIDTVILTPAVTVDNKEYDGTNAATVRSVTFNNLVSGETLTEGTDYTVTASFDSADVGEGKTVNYTVKLLDTEKAKNYIFTDNGRAVTQITGTATASITPATASVTTAPTANTLTYSGGAQALVTAGVANGGEMQYKLGEDGEWSTTVPSATDADTYTVYYRVVGDSNHNDSAEGRVEVTIAPKALTITAKPKTITYGDAPANDGVAYDGFVGGEDASALTGTLEYAYSYAQFGDVGNSYSITPSGLTSTNYAITFKPGTLTVSPKNIAEAVITLAPSSFVYDGSEKTQTVTSVTLEGFDSLTCDISGNVQTNAGTHVITATGTGNFTGTATTTFSIAKATPTGKPSYREIFDAFIRISKAELSTNGGTFSVPGTVEWVDENGDTLDVNTFVRSDTAYRWRFRPTDSTNYNDIFGEIVLWHYEEVTLPTPETKPEEPTRLNFRDVDPDDYFYKPVYWAVENDITTGTSRRYFSPYDACTRAQAVTFLWRAAGCPEPESKTMPFTDVSESSYYYEAVLWAVENGIVKGTSATTFGPDDNCTRSQIVTFLYRFAVTMSMDVSVGEDTNILSYNDAFDVPEYAISAFQWATGAGIAQGANGNLMPGNSCTRAQIVTFLYRALAK